MLGLRDLFPLSHSQLQVLKRALSNVLPSSPPDVKMTVAITEIEAWFVQEDLHFPKINPACTPQAILQKTGFDIEKDTSEGLAQPSKFLREAYHIGKTTYNKKKRLVVRTISSLDMENLYLNKRSLLTSFDEFVSNIEGFLQ
ncbi:hypothetical protein [Acidiphilium multivorum]|uniref:hypothetical protein n=1 Tax=Acidiphilium multivorum TaxID=62140 RepID=UPI001B8BC793|nr:hypothetical protein [Acidiphilium multivorum]MBS3025557.1 hypothetical protein [Acidiphilium multivorum]